MIDSEFAYLPPPRRRSGGLGRIALLGLLIAIVLFAGAAGLAWRMGMTIPGLPSHAMRHTIAPPAAAQPTTPPVIARPTLPVSDTTMAARIAALEQRADGADARANASTGNSSRAEALLIAFAVRRAVDRGAQLGYLEDQLRLRFGDPLPNSVTLITTAAKNPVTLDQLSTRLEAIAAALVAPPAAESTWDRVRHDLGGLFVLRRDPAVVAAPGGSARLEHARAALREGRVSDAMADVAALPGARDPHGPAPGWIAAARHYDEVQHALDLLETNALLEPPELKNGAGAELVDPQGLPPPAATGEAAQRASGAQ